MTTNEVKEFFLPGDEWIYFKIYCGTKVSDDILIEVVGPIFERLITDGIISKWFFIRYNDPDPHIRLRILTKSINKTFSIIKEIKNLLYRYVIQNFVWNVELSTYKREIERYGKNNIENAESFFFIDSQTVINHFIKEDNDIDRFLCVFKHIESLINLFEFSDAKKLHFLNSNQLAFKNEFKINSNTIRPINMKFKDFKEKYAVFVGTKSPINYEEYRRQISNIKLLSSKKKLGKSLENIASSLIHMSINRSFRANQRLHELLIYDFLYKLSKSHIARYGKPN